ncbi:hypothetical protein OWV82_014558 [Melia azedarach]|uniref:Uncharacterized protein n=1 Tax=Melia azedarach TaxID=155640 RepID=A0ACC1XNL4_MELAZ|nr:hypothetical protein OWV82_014558 [Melia azedarach]
MKVEKLQRLLLPGGHGLHYSNKLLLYTTHYIFYLRMRVSLLEAICSQPACMSSDSFYLFVFWFVFRNYKYHISFIASMKMDLESSTRLVLFRSVSAR